VTRNREKNEIDGACRRNKGWECHMNIKLENEEKITLLKWISRKWVLKKGAGFNQLMS
jgi:hypothetical protein